MTLSEYFEGFNKFVSGTPSGNFPRHVAAEVAAGHEIGLTFEQLNRFLARRTEITSVAVALKASTLSPEVVVRITEARQSGAVTPSEVLARAFSPAEVQEKFHHEVFSGKSA